MVLQTEEQTFLVSPSSWGSQTDQVLVSTAIEEEEKEMHIHEDKTSVILL